MRASPFVLALAGLLMLAVPAIAQPARVEWRLLREPEAATAQLTLDWPSGGANSSFGRRVSASSLQGLEWRAFDSVTAQEVAFRLERDAGTFTCRGAASIGSGFGHCDYTPSPSFNRGLAARGMAPASASQAFSLALADVGFAFIDALARDGYARPSTDQLVSAAHDGVGLPYLQFARDSGFRLRTLPELAEARRAGITPAYLAALRGYGLHDLSLSRVMALRRAGVSTRFLASLGSAGLPRFSGEELVRLRQAGVSPRFLASLSPGEGGATVESLIAARRG